MTFLFSGALTVLLLIVAKARALNSAACTDDGYKSYTNTLGQDPCEVASNMRSACYGADSSPFAPLKPGVGDSYRNHDIPSKCTCNTILYTVLSMCASCQKVGIDSWSNWTHGCVSTYEDLSKIPFPDDDTRIPSWAFTPLKNDKTLDTDSLNHNAAAGGQETDRPQSDNKCSKPVGAIAGGVVGGVVALVAFGVGLFFLHRRRARRQGGTNSNFGGAAKNEKAASDATRVQPLYDPDAHWNPNAAYNTDVTSPGTPPIRQSIVYTDGRKNGGSRFPEPM